MDHLTRRTSRYRGGRRLRRLIGPWLLVTVLTVTAACGSSNDDDVVLSEAGARGQDVARSNGCAGCHGSNGGGGVGPTWVGLYGADVALDNGTTVTADDGYLARAISNPGADIVKAASVTMPSNGLSDDEIADVIAYIRDLSNHP